MSGGKEVTMTYEEGFGMTIRSPCRIRHKPNLVPLCQNNYRDLPTTVGFA